MNEQFESDVVKKLRLMETVMNNEIKFQTFVDRQGLIGTPTIYFQNESTSATLLFRCSNAQRHPSTHPANSSVLAKQWTTIDEFFWMSRSLLPHFDANDTRPKRDKFT